MDKLLIFPYNGNGLEAVDCLSGEYELMGFIDDRKRGLAATGHHIFTREALARYPDAKVLAVPGGPASFLQREGIINSLGVPAERFTTVIHRNSSVSPLAKIGCNTLIMAGVVLTSNAVIGDHVCILPGSVVHHDVVVKDYTLIGANVTIAGAVRIGRNCYIGSGSRIINGISVGDGALVGLGTNVIRSLPAGVKAVGNPSRIIGDAP